MTSLFILGSCQDLVERPLENTEKIEKSFDKLKFLIAVNNASNNYVTERNNTKNGNNFRSIYNSDEVIYAFIDDVAAAYNSDDQWLERLPEWDEGEPLTNSITVYKNDLNPQVKTHIDNYEIAVNHIANQYENGLLTDIQAINQIKSISKARGNLINYDTQISWEERHDLSDIFYLMDEMTDDIALLLQDPTFETHRINKKWLRGLVRVVLVTAGTAAVIYGAGALIAAWKLKSLYLGHQAAFKALTLKATIGASGKLYPALTYGLGKGIITAAEKWDKDWEGVVIETKYAVKVAW